LQQGGARVCVLSRGYGGSAQGAITIVSDGKRCLVPPEVVGDEPVLLAEHLAELPVIAGKDRYAAGMVAIERFGADTIVLDDGFQHLQLARDLNILLLDAERPFGNGRLFPRGDLRDRPAAVGRADAIVLTRWESSTTAPSGIRHLGQATQPLFCSQHTPIDLRVLANGQLLPLTTLKGQRIVAFCGIGAPEHFHQTLQRLGADIRAFVAFADHHPYTRAEIEQLNRVAQQQRVTTVVTTEKDGVRLRHLAPVAGRIWELRIHATIVEQETAWRTLILHSHLV
jgi:tetraacyldisaccharide 4'-kinase